jgi:hypothetical protein
MRVDVVLAAIVSLLALSALVVYHTSSTSIDTAGSQRDARGVKVVVPLGGRDGVTTTTDALQARSAHAQGNVTPLLFTNVIKRPYATTPAAALSTDAGSLLVANVLPTNQPLVPLSKLNESESAKHLACQRASFARHKRPHAAGGARFVILQSNDYGKKSKSMVRQRCLLVCLLVYLFIFLLLSKQGYNGKKRTLMVH